jgi:hypothetical protein
MSSRVTVLIPISPIPTHPSTEILDQTMTSIRERLPEAEVILMFDGVTAAAEERRKDYDQFKLEALYKCNHEWQPAVPIVFDTHHHQSLMVKEALKLVRTPIVLFAEQDTPLHNHIPFDQLYDPITTGYCNVIRFHFEADIHPEHTHLMLDKSPIDILGVPFYRTRQWSQRPHLASTKYYQHIADTYFDDQPRFIEHIMYGIIAEGGDNYDEHRLHMYAPEGTLVRSVHLDGRRAGATHYDPSAS